MKQKRRNLILCSLVLITALFAEFYCFLEFRGDILTILGTGVIVLVAAFMTLDSVLSVFDGENTDEKKDTKQKESQEEMQKHLAELEKIQKAMFVVLKKNAVKEQEILRMVSQRQVQQREITVRTGKLIAKHEGESAAELADILHKIAGRPDVDGKEILAAIEAVSQNLDKLATGIREVKESIGNITITVPAAKVEAVEEIVQKPMINEIMEEIPTGIKTVEKEETPAAEEAAPVEEKAAEVPEMDMSDPNKMMSPDDIAALLASMGGEETPAAEEAAPVEEKAAEVPEMDMGDPNKMMSPDDIAALLASMGQ